MKTKHKQFKTDINDDANKNYGSLIQEKFVEIMKCSSKTFFTFTYLCTTHIEVSLATRHLNHTICLTIPLTIKSY